MTEENRFAERQNKLQHALRELKLDGILVTNIPNIRYLSNFSGSTAMMLVTPGESFFFTDFRYVTQVEEEVRSGEFIKVERRYIPDVTDKIKELGLRTVGVESSIKLGDYNKFKEFSAGDFELVPSEDPIEKLRLLKDGGEVDLIRRSLEVAAKAFEKTLLMVEENVSEKDIMAELDYNFKKGGGEKPAFDIIVASGHRGALPHGAASDKKIENGDFIVFDFGTVVSGYNSDITRTVHLGEISEEEESVYNVVLEAQKRALDGIKPGMNASDADALARDYISDKGYGDYFGHGLGHGLGLDVHEGPTVSGTGEAVLMEGMIFTVEPGIYLPGKFGVRIEDVVYLTAGGCEILTKLNKELTII